MRSTQVCVLHVLFLLLKVMKVMKKIFKQFCKIGMNETVRYKAVLWFVVCY